MANFFTARMFVERKQRAATNVLTPFFVEPLEVRHLPICEGESLRGFVSLRDILLRDLTEKDDEVRLMRAYIHSAPEL